MLNFILDYTLFLTGFVYYMQDISIFALITQERGDRVDKPHKSYTFAPSNASVVS